MSDILVIDSDRRYRTSTVQILADVGYQVRSAGNGAEGLAVCRRMRPALVITAIVMPDKDGIEIIRELSREMPDVPILATSESVNASLYLRAAILCGAAAALRTPFSADELLIAVAPLLDGSGNQRCKERSGRHREERQSNEPGVSSQRHDRNATGSLFARRHQRPLAN